MHANVIEVTEATFQKEVLDRSMEVPVVVDFWAPWCGPCRVLGPVLEKLAAEADGAWVLVKVNTEEAPQLATDFRIRGIPNVKAFSNGQVVDEFAGAMPESVVADWLRGIVPSENDEALVEAQRLEALGAVEQAAALYDEIHTAEPDRIDAHAGVIRTKVALGHVDEALAHLGKIPEHIYGTTEGVVERAWLAAHAATARPLEAARQAVDADPGDLQARFELGLQLASADQWEEAFSTLLGIVSRDRSFGDDLGRIAMIRLFEALGTHDELSYRWRGRLGSVMYV